MARILLVDDDQAFLSVQEEFLRREGHEVVTAGNGRQALRLVQERDFDLVITDIIMPDQEGIETIVTLRRTRPALKVIAMSGGGRLNSDDYLEMARRFGARTLAKPFTRRDLLDAVASSLDAAA
jgi:DNA-binding NtrC family response regulator